MPFSTQTYIVINFFALIAVSVALMACATIISRYRGWRRVPPVVAMTLTEWCDKPEVWDVCIKRKAANRSVGWAGIMPLTARMWAQTNESEARQVVRPHRPRSNTYTATAKVSVAHNPAPSKLSPPVVEVVLLIVMPSPPCQISAGSSVSEESSPSSSPSSQEKTQFFGEYLIGTTSVQTKA